MQQNNHNQMIIAYDGDCPFCAGYIRMQRLRELGLDVALVDFRDAPDLVASLKDKGLNPNDGMYVQMDGAEYYADAAMTALSLLSTPNTVLNRMFKWWFKSKMRARVLYPILRVGRNIALLILGRPQI